MYGIDRKQGPCKTSAFTTSIAENRKDSSNFYRLLGADKIQSSNVTKNLGGVTKTNSHQNTANKLQHNQIACKESTECHEQTSFHSDGPVDLRMSRYG